MLTELKKNNWRNKILYFLQNLMLLALSTSIYLNSKCTWKPWINVYADIRQLVPSYTQESGCENPLASWKNENIVKIPCITSRALKKKNAENSRWGVKLFNMLCLYWICQPAIFHSTNTNSNRSLLKLICPSKSKYDVYFKAFWKCEVCLVTSFCTS